MPHVTAMATLAYTGSTLEQALAEIAGHGFRRVEISHMGWYCRHYDFRTTRPAEVRRLFDRAGMEAVSMNYNVGRAGATDVEHGAYHLLDPDDARAYSQDVRTLIDDAAELGMRVLLVPTGARSQGPDAPAQREAAARLLSPLADYAASLGLRLGVELPHLYQLAFNIGTTREFLDALETDKLILCRDSTHWWVGRIDSEMYFAKLGPWLHHAHLRDARGGDTADWQQDLEVTPGKGEVDFRLFGAQLDDYGYRDELVLELEYRGLTVPATNHEVDAGIAYLKSCGYVFPAGV